MCWKSLDRPFNLKLCFYHLIIAYLLFFKFCLSGFSLALAIHFLNVTSERACLSAAPGLVTVLFNLLFMFWHIKHCFWSLNCLPKSLFSFQMTPLYDYSSFFVLRTALRCHLFQQSPSSPAMLGEGVDWPHDPCYNPNFPPQQHSPSFLLSPPPWTSQNFSPKKVSKLSRLGGGGMDFGVDYSTMPRRRHSVDLLLACSVITCSYFVKE